MPLEMGVDWEGIEITVSIDDERTVEIRSLDI